MDSLKNFARGTLSAGINSSATSASLTSGHGARFPSTAHWAVIWNQTDYGFDITAAYLAGEAEIVRVTARSTDALTITRGQDGTVAVALNSGGKTYGLAQVANVGLFADLVSDLAAKAAVSLTLNAQTGTSYTLVLADNGKDVTLDNAAGITLTVPLNSSVAFPIGAQIALLQLGAGQVTVAGASGVTVNSRGAALKLSGQYAPAALHKVAADAWVLIGDITA